MSADRIIAKLGLLPHPEGGWYRQTWVGPLVGGRASGTAILFLLQAGERSHWHRVDADEIWLWHAGSPLVLSMGKEVAEGIASGRMCWGVTLCRRWCLRAGGRRRGPWGSGRWSAARCLRASGSRGLTSPRRGGSCLWVGELSTRGQGFQYNAFNGLLVEFQKWSRFGGTEIPSGPCGNAFIGLRDGKGKTLFQA
jgi:uncharacterized protein